MQMKEAFVGELLELAADLIKDHPTAAELLARRGAALLKREEQRAELRREERREAVRHGRNPYEID